MNDWKRQGNEALAMSYVPFQEWEKIFEPKDAMQMGTAFPSLVFPFYERGGC
ncbi:MAG: spore coat associated protein CotJA [Clostridia bacterium]|nr:spore coat associated protein CotJA [Clostridia bacterium]